MIVLRNCLWQMRNPAQDKWSRNMYNLYRSIRRQTVHRELKRQCSALLQIHFLTIKVLEQHGQ
jgi:hypothetical protein